MKKLGAILCLIFGFLFYADNHAQFHKPDLGLNTLENARWKNRIIVTCSKSHALEGTSFGANYIDSIDRAGFAERDILILHILQKPRTGILAIAHTPNPDLKILTHEDEVAAVTRKAKCTKDTNAIALIGKDGQVKKIWRDQRPSDSELFDIIDSMPMRRMEMREQTEP